MPSLVELDKNLLKMSAQGDGDILAQNDLVYVDTMIQNPIVGWSTRTFEELRQRDIWQAGGGEAYANRLEEIERAAELRKRRKMIDDIEHRAGDAWRSYQARTGQRTRLPGTVKSSGAKIVQVGRL